MNSIESQGIVLAVSDGGSPTAYSAIPNIVNMKGPGGSASVMDVTNLASTAKEKRMGLPDEGQFSLEVNYDPDNAVHAQLRTSRRNRTRVEFKMTLTDGTPATNFYFSGYVLSFELSAAVDQVVKASITIEIDGAVVDA